MNQTLPVEPLLRMCARIRDNTPFASELLSSVDWDAFIRQAEAHAVSPLVYKTLTALDCKELVPEHVIKTLKNAYIKNKGFNMIRFHELGNILRTFKSEGIDTICLKGSCLAETVYKDIGLRIMRDIDVLIKDNDVATAKRELEKLHYTLVDCYPTKWHEQWWTLLCEDAQIRYGNVEKRLMIELHWHIQHLSSPYPVDIAAFWANAQSVTISTVETLMFSPEDLIHHLCLHAYKHAQKRGPQLRQYCDIAVVTHEYCIDWDYLVERARQWGTDVPVYASLSLSVPVGGCVPRHVLNSLRTAGTVEPVVDSGLNFFTKKRRIIHLKSIAKVEGTKNKMRILIGEFFPCREAIAKTYAVKGNKVFLYYLVNGITLFYEGITVLKHFLKKE